MMLVTLALRWCSGVEAGCLDGAKVAAGMHCGGKMDDITCIISSVRAVGGSSGGASLEPD